MRLGVPRASWEREETQVQEREPSWNSRAGERQAGQTDQHGPPPRLTETLHSVDVLLEGEPCTSRHRHCRMASVDSLGAALCKGILRLPGGPKGACIRKDTLADDKPGDLLLFLIHVPKSPSLPPTENVLFSQSRRGGCSERHHLSLSWPGPAHCQGSPWHLARAGRTQETQKASSLWRCTKVLAPQRFPLPRVSWSS